jgi:ATP-dependent Clp protease ATP-binding subunit ClpA
MIEERWSDAAKKVLETARRRAFEFGHGAIECSHLLLALAEAERGASRQSIGADVARLRPRVESLHPRAVRAGGTPETLELSRAARAAVIRALAEAESAAAGQAGRAAIEPLHIAIALAADEEGEAARLLVALGLSPAAVVRAGKASRAGRRAPGRRDDALWHDLILRASRGELDPFLGRDEELDRLYETLLRRDGGHAIVVGPPGAGKTSLVRGLATAIANGSAPGPLLGHRVLALDTSALLDDARFRGQLEERILGLLEESRSRAPVVYVLDDAGELVNGDREANDAGLRFLATLSAALDRRETRFVLALEPQAEPQLGAALPTQFRRFERIELAPLDRDATIAVLKTLAPALEAYHSVSIDDAALIAAAATEDDGRRALPGRAVDRLDRACARIAGAHAAPQSEIVALDAEIATLEEDERRLATARDYLGAAAARRALDPLLERRDAMHASARAARRVDAAAVTA